MSRFEKTHWWVNLKALKLLPIHVVFIAELLSWSYYFSKYIFIEISHM